MTHEPTNEANPIGTHLLFEDEQIRVWQILLEPGQEAPVHTHENDYTTFTIEGDLVERPNGDGTVDRITVRPGRVMRWYQGTPRHGLRNVGTKTFRNVIFELKTVPADFDSPPSQHRANQGG